MFSTDKVVFKKLAKLPISKRMSVAKSPEGKSILGSLTPSQLAELFPRYYQQGLPDIGGFREATTAAARERQSEASASLLDRLTKAEKSLEEYVGAKYHEIKRKLGFEPKAPAGLTPEQEAAWNKVMSGAVDINSSEGKIFSKLTDQQLNGLGISKSKDNTGRDVFQYAQPESTREEAISRMKTSGSGGNKFFDSIIRAEGTGKHGDPYNTSLGYMKSPKPLTDMTMQEALDWGDQIRKAQGMNSSAKGAFQIVNTTQRDAMKALGIGMDEKFSPENQRKMAAWIVKQQGLGAWEGFKVHPDERQNATLAMQEGLHNQFSSALKPEGPNGSYSDDQINKMMVQLKDEKNASRKQQLANLLTDAGVDTATVNKIQEGRGATVTSTEAWSSIQPIGGQSYCGRGVANLAEQIYGRDHFDNPGHLGNGMASDLSYGARNDNKFSRSGMYKTGQSIGQEALTADFLKNLPPGTIISAGGGRMDGAGHIQMKVGDRWASDHWQNDFSFGRRDGRMYKDFVIHYPSDKGLAVMQQKGLISNVAVQPELASAPPPPTASKVAKVNEIEDDKSLPNVLPNEQQVIEKARETAAAPATAPVINQTVVVNQPPAIQKAAPAAPPNKFRVDQAGFLAAIRATPQFKEQAGFFADAVPDSTIISGFNSNADVVAAGVKYDAEKGIMTFKDANHPGVKEVMKDFDTKKFMTPIEEKKKEEVKPKVEAPPPQPQPTQPAKQPQPQAATPPAEAKPVQTAPAVPGASDGGSFNVPGQVDFYPMDKRDNIAAVDTKTQQPLFTARGGERIDVTPSQKVQGAFNPTDTGIRNEFDALRQEMSSNFGDMNEPTNATMRETTGRKLNPDTVADFTGTLNKQNKDKQYHNAAFERAMLRTRLQESGDPLNNHFSGGNTNYS